MLDWLEIKNFTITEHTELEFEENFTVVTGETGSGKSIMVDAVALLLGQRFDKIMIRHNQPQTELQASFNINDRPAVTQWLMENDLHIGSCIIKRVLRRDKPSKNYINGSKVMVSQLKQLGQMLIDIHSQNEHHSLLNKNLQQAMLDEAANSVELLKELNHTYQNIKDINNRIDQLGSQQQASQERLDLLTFQLEELEELSPLENEWLKLEAQHKYLNHQQDLSQGIEKVITFIDGPEQATINHTLTTCLHEIQQLTQFDQRLDSIEQMLSEAQINIKETSEQLKKLSDENNLDAQEVQSITQRFSLYHRLSRKHRVEPEELFNRHQSLAAEIHSINNPAQDLSDLKSQLDKRTKDYHVIAEKISSNRQSTAKKLNREITNTIQELGMPKGLFQITLHDKEESINPTGNESVEFLVKTNPGQPLQSLSKTASGGELSRISLAIQVTLANKNQTPTLIFDEVDVGISGKIADIVGQKLKQLGRTAQVICITHLAQVAAKGNTHFSVTKTSNENTNTQVKKLNKENRVKEIARMSGGQHVTKESLAHAEKMLKTG